MNLPRRRKKAFLAHQLLLNILSFSNRNRLTNKQLMPLINDTDHRSFASQVDAICSSNAFDFKLQFLLSLLLGPMQSQRTARLFQSGSETKAMKEKCHKTIASNKNRKLRLLIGFAQGFSEKRVT
jgi:hypothetical protein